MKIEDSIKNLNSMRLNYDQRDKKSIPIQTIDLAIAADEEAEQILEYKKMMEGADDTKNTD